LSYDRHKRETIAENTGMTLKNTAESAGREDLKIIAIDTIQKQTDVQR
jgi:hypothetical protein